MKGKYDIFDMHTGKFITTSDNEYDDAYIQFLKDLDEYNAEQDIMFRILSQKYHTHDWNKESMD